MNIIALVISGISLILAILSFIFSVKSQRLQNKVNKLELKLKEYELDDLQQQACIEARIIHIHKNHYKMKIWNSGKSTAKNIVASWDATEYVLIFDKEKMPFEELKSQKSFELSISTYNGSPRKLNIKTEWDDENGIRKERTQWCDF